MVYGQMGGVGRTPGGGLMLGRKAAPFRVKPGMTARGRLRNGCLLAEPEATR